MPFSLLYTTTARPHAPQPPCHGRQQPRAAAPCGRPAAHAAWAAGGSNGSSICSWEQQTAAAAAAASERSAASNSSNCSNCSAEQRRQTRPEGALLPMPHQQRAAAATAVAAADAVTVAGKGSVKTYLWAPCCPCLTGIGQSIAAYHPPPLCSMPSTCTPYFFGV